MAHRLPCRVGGCRGGAQTVGGARSPHVRPCVVSWLPPAHQHSLVCFQLDGLFIHPKEQKKKKKDGSLQPCESQANDQQFRTCPCPIHSFRLTRIVCIVTFQSFTVQAQCDDNRDTGPKHGVVMSGGQRSSRLNTGYGGPQDDWLSLRLTQFSHQASATLRGVDLSSKSKSWHRARF